MPSTEQPPEQPSGLIGRVREPFRTLLLVVLCIGCAWAFGAIGKMPANCDGFHLNVALAQSAEGANTFLKSCQGSIESIRLTLALDTIFALAYGVVLWQALTYWWTKAWKTESFLALKVVRFLPYAVAAFDIAENVSLAAGISQPGEALQIGGWAWRAALIFGWWKLGTALLAVLATTLALSGRVGELLTPALRPNASENIGPTGDIGDGICLSGGGIRAASFALGALQGLDEKGCFRPARYLSAVSGGAYLATGWFVARGKTGEAKSVLPAPTVEEDGLLNATSPSLHDYLAENRRYLSTGRGALPASFVVCVLFILLNLALLAGFVFVIAWPIGRLAASAVIAPDLYECTYKKCTAVVSSHLWSPAIAAGVLGLVFLAVSLGFKKRSWQRAVHVITLALLVMAALASTLVLIPLALVHTPEFIKNLEAVPAAESAKGKAGVIGLFMSLGLGTALARWALKPVGKLAPRLGGVFLALMALLFAGWIATEAAYARGRLDEPWVYGVIAGAFVAAYWLLNQRWWSLHTIYLPRLRSTFATKQVPANGTREILPRGYAEEGTWDEYANRNEELGMTLPELLVCCAAQRSDRASTGVPALSFTFSPREVVLTETKPTGPDGTVEVRTHRAPMSSYTQTIRASFALSRFVGDSRLIKPFGAAAMSGAAFTSAMGRHSLGSTNAVLAALNLRLGVWMPNPMYVPAHPPVPRFPVPRLNYLIKEVFGVFDLKDPYLYITDGGHWENLGLVELIRRRCPHIFCMDASGDRPGSFDTLKEAMTLARVECNATLEIDLERLIPDKESGMARDCVAIGLIRYHSGPDHTAEADCGDECPFGVLIYAKSVMSPFAPLSVQAHALEDPKFPNYSTGDQFLTRDQLNRLVALGRCAAFRAGTKYIAVKESISTGVWDAQDPVFKPISASFQGLTTTTAQPAGDVADYAS